MEIASVALLLWRIHKISNFVEFSTHILLTFSANSCKVVLLLPFLVITKVVKLSVFKCIEVFRNKGAKDFNMFFIANNSLQVYDSNRSFAFSFHNRYVSLTHSQKLLKNVSWVNHRRLMVCYWKNLFCFSKILIF